MAVESPAFANQNSTYGAEQTRRAIASLLARGASIGSVSGGIVSSTDCQLTPPGSGMTVNVAPGEVWVPGSSSATQSGYYCRVSSNTSLAIATSDPSNPRIDRVVALITDSAYSGVTNTFAVSVVTGTPTAGATLVNLTGVGAAPASSYTLGYVLVPATSTSVTGGNISNVAGVAAFGLGGSRGAALIATSQATSSTTYTTLATPDQVTGIVVPTNGLIRAWYQATWQESVAGAGRAAIFVGTNQAKAGTTAAGGPGTQAAATTSTSQVSTNYLLASGAVGLGSVPAVAAGTSTGYTGDVTTGQIVGPVIQSFGQEFNGVVQSIPSNMGGPCDIKGLPAGTYTVSVQFKASSGSVTASNRLLLVQVILFS